MTTYIPLFCSYCKKSFKKPLFLYNNSIKRKDKHSFCSIKCVGLFQRHRITKPCKKCGKLITRQHRQMKSTNVFCNHSCACSYNNTHKTKGIRRSKLEIFIEKQLNKLFPQLPIVYNNKETINSELDIYIPSLSLAFELNGIFHYEPIFGQEKLNKIQNNDNRKIFACAEKNIELCIIDSSSLKYFKPKHTQKYLDIIVSLISQKLNNF